ncbi:hypothetical protein H4582DRAFT_682921 [Lactarius indigo]|nr:hypothetical protein H4582DRAFT_682921 [Lactarius indigo]
MLFWTQPRADPYEDMKTHLHHVLGYRTNHWHELNLKPEREPDSLRWYKAISGFIAVHPISFDATLTDLASIDSSGLARGASERGFEDTSSSEDGFDVEILRRAPAWNPTALARPATIDMLPDDTLLKIFGFYQMSSPLHWHRLAHICQKWRSIIFESSRKPDLRLCRSTPASRPR